MIPKFSFIYSKKEVSMPAKKKAAKPVPRPKIVKKAKPAPKKVVKKAAVKKPVAKKPVVKKSQSVKKSVPKKQANNNSKPVKKIVKKATKPVSKKAAPVKKAAPPAKPVVKKAVKPAAKPVTAKAKPAPAKSAPAKSVVAPAKKTVVSKPSIVVPKQEPVKKATPSPALTKAPVKEAIKELKKEAKKPTRPENFKPPVTTVSTIKTYKPDFVKSVLDQGQSEHQSKVLVRYSDAELTEFKDLIVKKLDAAKKELIYLQGLITHKDAGNGDDGEGRYMTMENGSESMEREQLSQMASRQITYIDHLEKALMRVENKTYGVCRITGKLIDKARLKAVPHATLSMEAKLGQHKVPSQSE